MVYLNCACLEYIGDKPFKLTDESGKKITLEKNQTIIIPRDDLYRSLKYKRIFQEVEMPQESSKKPQRKANRAQTLADFPTQENLGKD